VDLEVPRSSRGGGTSHFNGLAGQSELIASQKSDWEAHGKQRRDFSGAALSISSSSPATREDAAGTHATAELALFGSKALIHCSCSDHCTTFAPWPLIAEQMSAAISAGPPSPGRVDHCMRAIGQAERALEAMCRRASVRSAVPENVGPRALGSLGRRTNWRRRLASVYPL